MDEETRRANLIVVNVAPSAADKAEGQALVDSVIVNVRNTPAIDAGEAGDTNLKTTAHLRQQPQ